MMAENAMFRISIVVLALIGGHAHSHDLESGSISIPDNDEGDGGERSPPSGEYGISLSADGTQAIDGETFEGGFARGARHGRGVLAYADGRRYEGGFKDGHMHGTGTHTWPENYQEDRDQQGPDVRGEHDAWVSPPPRRHAAGAARIDPGCAAGRGGRRWTRMGSR